MTIQKAVVVNTWTTRQEYGPLKTTIAIDPLQKELDNGWKVVSMCSPNITKTGSGYTEASTPILVILEKEQTTN